VLLNRTLQDALCLYEHNVQCITLARLSINAKCHECSYLASLLFRVCHCMSSMAWKTVVENYRLLATLLCGGIITCLRVICTCSIKRVHYARSMKLNSTCLRLYHCIILNYHSRIVRMPTQCVFKTFERNMTCHISWLARMPFEIKL